MEQTEQLARKFSELLREEIGTMALQQVIDLNREEGTDSGVCHSHDFCDANMTMLMAQESLHIIQSEDPDDAHRWDLVNAAWETAKKNDFYFFQK